MTNMLLAILLIEVNILTAMFIFIVLIGFISGVIKGIKKEKSKDKLKDLLKIN